MQQQQQTSAPKTEQNERKKNTHKQQQNAFGTFAQMHFTYYFFFCGTYIVVMKGINYTVGANWDGSRNDLVQNVLKCSIFDIVVRNARNVCTNLHSKNLLQTSPSIHAMSDVYLSYMNTMRVYNKTKSANMFNIDTLRRWMNECRALS